MPSRMTALRAALIFLASACLVSGRSGAAPQAPSEPPAAAPKRFLGLIGEYGRSSQVDLFIIEKDGQLQAQDRGKPPRPLKEIEENEFEYAADAGTRSGARVTFVRSPNGRANSLKIGADYVVPRRGIKGEDGQTFRIKPVRLVETIRRETAGLQPPTEVDKPAKPDLVDLVEVVPRIAFDIRYASSNNFLGTPLYTSSRALMQRPAAEALARVQAKLLQKGYGLLIYDAYRPWRVTKLFWEATPEAQHTFVADPAKGSKHNRGCAVDLTLREMATGQVVEMVGGYDEFSDRSYPNYPGGTSRQRWHRDYLRSVMESEGFTVNEAEWWHFDYKDWDKYPILDTPFEALPTR